MEILHQIEQKNKKQRGGRFVLSPQDVYNNLIENKEEDSIGRSIKEALEWVCEHGCILETNCTYKGRFMPITYLREPYMRVTTFRQINLQQHVLSRTELEKCESKVREAILIAPVAAHLIWINEMQQIKDGIYSGPKDEASFDKTGDHGVIVVGFGQSTRNDELVKYWIVRNSHGKRWGNKGYGKINLAPTHGRLLVQSVWIVRGLEKM
ncbi:cathepsin 7-like [Trifolium pratense]|uniref:cathepsin 7-like n=1 Tax=Trifolium pratense TaxID=57577 RepID=UPI001E690038|nr:cathepsin 7-like [Trifolium pratense]